MMFNGLLRTGLVLCVTSAAFAKVPAVAPPMQQLARVDSAGQLKVIYQILYCVPETMQRSVQRKVPVTKEVQENVDGEIRKKLVTSYETVQETMTYTVSKTVCEAKVRNVELQEVKAFETDGKPIPLKKLSARLAEETLVVVSSNEEMIPDYYAGLFKPGTIVLAFKQEAVPPQALPPIQAPAAPIQSPPPNAARGNQSVRVVSQPKEAEDVEIRVPEGAPASPFPKSPHPKFVFAVRDGEDYKVRQTTENTFEATGSKIKQQGTKKEKMTVQMKHTIRHSEITSVAGKDVQFFAGDGSPLASERAGDKLSSREITTLYSADGDLVDPFWLQNLKPSTLVLVGPQLPGGCGAPIGYAAPMPAPVLPYQANPPSPAPAPVIPVPAPPRKAVEIPKSPA